MLKDFSEVIGFDGPKPVCNQCGKEFDLWDMQEDFSIERFLGYGTKYDGSKLNIRLCCDCMEKLIDECTISPISDFETEAKNNGKGMKKWTQIWSNAIFRTMCMIC